MGPYIGEASATVDDKNRLTLPKKFRNQLNSHQDSAFVIYFMPGFDGSDFVIMDAERGAQLLERFAKQQLGPSSANRSKRLAGMFERIEVDKAGRALLPASLLSRRNIEGREFVITGAVDHLEVFSKEKWERLNTELDDDAISALWDEFQAEPSVKTNETMSALAASSSTSAG